MFGIERNLVDIIIRKLYCKNYRNDWKNDCKYSEKIGYFGKSLQKLTGTRIVERYQKK